MKLFADIISSVLEVLVLNYFFNQVLVNRKLSSSIKIIINIICVSLFTLISTISYISNYISILFIVILILYSILLYKDKLIKKLIFSILIYIFGILAEVVVGIVLSSLYGESINETVTNIYTYLQGIVISKLLQFFILRIIGLLRFNNRIEINIKSFLSIIIIPIAGIVSIYYFSMVAFKADNLISSTLLIVLTVLTTLSNVATFYLLEKQVELQKTEDTLKNLEKQYKLQAEYYTELKQNMIVSNKNTHDIKNFVTAISSYIDNQKTDAAKSKINEFLGKIPSISKINTGNDAVNALVQSKLKDINEQIPDNNISIIIPQKVNVDEIDLCILIGNAVDNAVEACKKIADVKNRMLGIKIFPVNGQLSMLFENSKNSFEVKSAGIFKTTKKDAFMHGFGIENMKNIVQKYSGSITFDQAETRFVVSILLPN